MKFFLSLASALAVLQVVNGGFVYVTKTHTTTVVGGAPPPPKSSTAPAAVVKLVQSDTPAPAAPATTTVAAPAPPKSTAAAPAAPASASGIYADIAKSPRLDAEFAKSILDGHNTDRAAHQAPPLTWDKDLYDFAQSYADKYDCSGKLVHSGGEYGENLAVGFASGTAALTAWYQEGDNFDYSNKNQYTHFTQVIWKSTTKLGCAIKDCSSTGWSNYVICSYDPAGNLVGAEAENVLP